MVGIVMHALPWSTGGSELEEWIPAGIGDQGVIPKVGTNQLHSYNREVSLCRLHEFFRSHHFTVLASALRVPKRLA